MDWPKGTSSVGGNVIDFAAHARNRRVDLSADLGNFPFTPDHPMPARLNHASNPRMAEAQADATDALRRSVGNLSRFVAQPENIYLLAGALEGQTAFSGSGNINEGVLKVANLLHPSNADVRPPLRAQAVHSAPHDALNNGPLVNALPLPVAMAYVDRSDGPDRVLFSRDLGFRDMQVQAEYAAPIYLVKLAQSVGLTPEEPAALNRVFKLLRSSSLSKMIEQPAVSPDPVKVLLDKELVDVPVAKSTRDHRL